MCLAVGAVGAATFLYARAALNGQEIRQAQHQMGQNLGLLRTLRARVDEIEKSAKTDIPTPETIRTSLVRFEDDYLIGQADGTWAVIQEVNRLASDTRVSLSEINFDPIEEEDQSDGGAASQRGGKSLFPGLEMSFTVEGNYADVRRFLIGLENSKAFLIITSQELKSVESAGGPRVGLGAAASTTQVIALGIKLAAYFERGNHEQG
jgi:hypothetical protein